MTNGIFTLDATRRANGNVIVALNPTVTVFLTGTETLADIFDSEGEPQDNPFAVTGITIEFWADTGALYDVKIEADGADDRLLVARAVQFAEPPAPPAPPVDSVNGKTGEVLLTAGDVGAYPDSNPDGFVDRLGAVLPVLITINGNTQLDGTHNGATLIITANAVLTLPTWAGGAYAFEIIPSVRDTHTITIATQGSDTVRDSLTVIDNDAAVFRSSASGVWVSVGEVSAP
jgi:hypothetical protein